MLFTSPTQYAVLALLLVVGWLFGFASHSGGRKWRDAYHDETRARAHDRDEIDGRLRQANARVVTLEQEKAALEARSAELEARLRGEGAPVAAAIAPATAGSPAEPVATAPSLTPPVLTGAGVGGVVAASAARPAFPPHSVTEPIRPNTAQLTPATTDPRRFVDATPDTPTEPAPLPIKRSWFDWRRGDDLTRLRGVDAELEARLKTERVDTFAELAGLSDRDEVALERRLDLPAGWIMKEQLREQARLLADGRADEHARRFG